MKFDHDPAIVVKDRMFDFRTRLGASVLRLRGGADCLLKDRRFLRGGVPVLMILLEPGFNAAFVAFVS